METLQNRQAPRATSEQAERLDYLNAEIHDNWQHYSHTGYRELSHEYRKLASDYDWRDEIFEENGKKGMKNIKGEVIVPAIYDDFGTPENYYATTPYVCAYLDGKAGLVMRDGSGTPVTAFEFHHMERIFDTDTYAVWKPDDLTHFALMNDGKTFTPYELTKYGYRSPHTQFLYTGDKVGVLAYGTTYVRPEYDRIDNYGNVVKDGIVGLVTNECRFVSDEELRNLSDEEHVSFISDKCIDLSDNEFFIQDMLPENAAEPTDYFCLE